MNTKALKEKYSCFICVCRSDFVTSYFLAFSNDSREWTTVHDGYADWVCPPKTAHTLWISSDVSQPTMTPPSLLPSYSLEMVIRTLL